MRPSGARRPTSPGRRPRPRRRPRRRPSVAARTGGGPRPGPRGRAGRPGRRAGARPRRRGRRRAPSRRAPAPRDAGGVVGLREPAAQGGGAVADVGGRHPEQVGDLVGARTPDRPGGHDGPLERGRRAHDRLERHAHRVVVPGVLPRVGWHAGGTPTSGGGGAPTGCRVVAPTAAFSTERRAVIPGRPSSRASRHCWCRVARALVVTRRAAAASSMTTKATPSRSGQRAATKSRKSSSTVRVTIPVSHRGSGANRSVQGQRSAAAPSSTSSWLCSLSGSNSPVTSQMTRCATLTAWSANRS